MATWITDDGSYKVEVVSTVDRGQFVTVKQWVRDHWVFTAEAHPVRGLTKEEIGDLLIAFLAKYLDPATLVESPSTNDGWDSDPEDPESSAARWTPELAER